MKEKDIESRQHTTWRCQYHVVFARVFSITHLFVLYLFNTSDKQTRLPCVQSGLLLILMRLGLAGGIDLAVSWELPGETYGG